MIENSRRYYVQNTRFRFFQAKLSASLKTEIFKIDRNFTGFYTYSNDSLRVEYHGDITMCAIIFKINFERLSI